MFFVISGFLITRILLNTRENPYYFRNFYVRRSLRIFPIYYLTLAGYFLVLAVTPSGSALHSIFAGTAARPFALAPYYVIYLQTIPQLHSNYKDLPLLTVTWSLAIEEQFYWIWPFVIAFVRRAWLLPILAFLFFLAPLTRTLLLARTGNPYYLIGLLPDQFDSLAIGAAIAWFVVQGVDRKRLQTLGRGSLILGALGTLLLVARTGYSGFWLPALWAIQPQNALMYTALAFLFGGVIMLSVTEAPSMRWLRSPLLVHIGKVSYGIYLYHGFVMLLVYGAADRLRHLLFHDAPFPHVLNYGFSALCLIGSYVAAILSWRVIETPINALKDRYTKK